MCTICQNVSPLAAEWLHPEAPIHAELPSSVAATLTPGQSRGGQLTEGDTDWFRLDVAPGETFTVRTSDGASGTARDTLLVLYDPTGREVALDDDSGPGFHAEIRHQAQGATYYVAVTTYQAHYGYEATDTGTYTLSLLGRGGDAPDPDDGKRPILTNDEIAEQLARGYWEARGDAERGYDVSVARGHRGTITVDIDRLSDAGAWFAEKALDVWSAVTGLTFVESGADAQIRFDDNETGAFTRTRLRADGATDYVEVNVSTAWIEGEHYEYDAYALQTYIHEVGHALGLGHSGNYDVGGGDRIAYASHAEFVNDSWQATVMSYFDQRENTETDGSRAYLLTPTAADILAVEMLYGRHGGLRTGDTVYGEHSNAGDFYESLDGRWHKMAFTILDDGGHDLLDLSATGAHQRIDLAPESFSDVGGLTGNMGIARGTILEDVASGSGNDSIQGNRAGNRLEGGRGNDTIDGAAGRDRLIGGDGYDRLYGGGGRDRLQGEDDGDRLSGGAGRDLLDGGQGADRLDGGPGRDRLIGGTGGDTFVFAPRSGKDRIDDFQPGFDRLDFSLLDIRSLDDLLEDARERKGDLILVLDGRSLVRLEDVQADDLVPDDLIL